MSEDTHKPAVERIYVKEEPKSIRRMSTKIGMEPGMTPERRKKAKVYRSWVKNLTLIGPENKAIQFQNRMYVTDNLDDQVWIENTPICREPGIPDGIWKGKYPSDVQRRFDEDKALIRRDEDNFTRLE